MAGFASGLVGSSLKAERKKDLIVVTFVCAISARAWPLMPLQGPSRGLG